MKSGGQQMKRREGRTQHAHRFFAVAACRIVRPSAPPLRLGRRGGLPGTPQLPRGVHAGAFSEGIACVTRNGKTGYIDKSGSFTVEPRFDAMHPEWSAFSE